MDLQLSVVSWCRCLQVHTQVWLGNMLVLPLIFGGISILIHRGCINLHSHQPYVRQTAAIQAQPSPVRSTTPDSVQHHSLPSSVETTWLRRAVSVLSTCPLSRKQFSLRRFSKVLYYIAYPPTTDQSSRVWISWSRFSIWAVTGVLTGICCELISPVMTDHPERCADSHVGATSEPSVRRWHLPTSYWVRQCFIVDLGVCFF